MQGMQSDSILKLLLQFMYLQVEPFQIRKCPADFTFGSVLE